MTTPASLLQLRNDTRAITTLATSDLERLIRTADGQAVEALRDVLPALIETYGSAAATVAADWYDDIRDSSAVRGRFTAIPASLGDQGAQALLGWALTEARDDASFVKLVTGGAQRRMANFSRLTVTGSAIADPAADGWQRTGSGECAFCAMLIGRGAVYSEATADFASHDHCNCGATPAFGGQPRPVKPFTPSLRDSTAADRSRVRAWISDH